MIYLSRLDLPGAVCCRVWGVSGKRATEERPVHQGAIGNAGPGKGVSLMSRIQGDKQMHSMRNTMAKGFTLVEILIVVVILGILAAIVVPQFTNAANEARQGNVETQTSTLENQLELYAAQNNGNYPTVAQLNADPADGSTNGWSVMIDGDYIKEAPSNPYAPAANAFTVTNSNAANSAAADAEANAGDGSQGWYYNPNTGRIRASGGSY